MGRRMIGSFMRSDTSVWVSSTRGKSKFMELYPDDGLNDGKRLQSALKSNKRVGCDGLVTLHVCHFSCT